ncbi:FAD-binding oxidoreductase [Granulicella rosea]|nr:FAD-binding oxidoreductase [Granulicella rosea]
MGDETRVITQASVVERLSRDFYWYSPVLRELLDGKRADVVVQPVSTDEIRAVLRYCHAHDVPVTVRGAGTGNYGQSVPLAGGVLLDLQRMDRVLDISDDGVAECEPGARLGVLETTAREKGWELRCYPSTVVKASVGGFLGGGSGGIGSVAHGGLRDFNTVRAIEVVTMEAEPRVLMHEGEAVHDILHAWGSNGVMTRIWLALAPSVEWAQCAVSFRSFEAAFAFSEQIAVRSHWTKRLVTVFEWPIPSFFSPVRTLLREGEAAVFLMIAEAQRAKLEDAAMQANGNVTLSVAYGGLKSTPLLSDYTWNHTTLWAMKADPTWTYLQCGFDPARATEQLALLKTKYGADFLHHIEWMKNGAGVVFPAAIPVVRFSTAERLNEMIDYCRSIGVGVANPHVNHVEGGGRYREDNVQLQAKYRYDAKGLMNPGKMATFERREVTA